MRCRTPIVLATAAVVAIPSTAHAGCGYVKTAPSKRSVANGPQPLAIGDSVMLLAINRLARAGFDVNAQGCRQWRQGEAILRRKKRRHRLPHLVVMALGTNWSITRDEIGHTRRMLGKHHVLAIVTPREPAGSGDAKRIRAAARAHRRRIKLIDWVRLSRGHGGWFGGDGIHLTYTGVTHYVRFIRRSLRWAN
jgi:hypothetical protein